MRLRYAGTCRLCESRLNAGAVAIYERSTKTVRCYECAPEPAGIRETITEQSVGQQQELGEPLLGESPTQPLMEVDSGQAGASARREHERRRDRAENRIRSEHPHLGRLILAFTSDPQSTTAWATGAVGEERLGARLNDLASPSVRVLHDRRIPRTRANIDHIVVCPSGVLVIDAKKYKGRPQLRVEGGILRPRTETLIVGRRNCSKLVDGVLRQVDLVRAAFDGTPSHEGLAVRGMLCFVGADWPLIGGSFSTRGVEVLWPKKAAAQIQQPGPLDDAEIDAIHRCLAESFPPA